MDQKKSNNASSIDPAVSGLLAGMEQHQAESALPRKERERIVKERLKIQARRDQRATYDLPPVIREELKTLAESQGVPASQLATLALARFLQDFEKGQVSLDDYKQPSRSPRYDWNLVFPESLVPIRSRKKGRSS